MALPNPIHILSTSAEFVDKLVIIAHIFFGATPAEVNQALSVELQITELPQDISLLIT